MKVFNLISAGKSQRNSRHIRAQRAMINRLECHTKHKANTWSFVSIKGTALTAVALNSREFGEGLYKAGAFILICAIYVAVSLSAQSAQAAFNPAKVFDKKCSSCHSIGGGDLKGPDLKDITKRRDRKWLLEFIPSAETMINAGDPEAVKVYNKYGQKDMPDQKLSETEINAILDFIETGGQQEISLDVKSALDATEEDVLRGQEIYLGSIALESGGPACVACHSVGQHGPLGGGTLAKDLTHIYSDYKDKGLSVALKKLAFPVMEEVYAGKPLTDEEAYSLKAFLYKADKEGLEASDFQKKFLFLGLGGAILAMGVIDFTWRRRRKQSVRRNRGGLR